ncbi:zinc finger, CCHC-type containing protein [Tanacetum coccineum]
MDNPNITIEEYIRLEEEKVRRHGKVYNWETANYSFNDELSSEKTLSCEPTVSSLNNNEIDFRVSFDKSDDEDYAVIFDKNSFSYKIISVNDLKTDSENDNEKVNMPSFPSPKPKVSCFDDLDFFKDFENEFPAIVYNDALTFKSEYLTEPTLCPQHINKFDFQDETSLSGYDEVEQNVLYFNDLFPFNIIYPDDLKSEFVCAIWHPIRPLTVLYGWRLHKNVAEAKYTDTNIADFEERLGRIYDREVHRVQVFDFRGLTELMDEGLRGRMLMGHRDAQGQSVITSRAWRQLFKIRGPLVHELILEFFSTFRFGEVVLDLDTVGPLQFLLGGVRRRMSWREFILGMGLHTAQEIESVGFDFLRFAPSYTYIRDPVQRLCHRLISYNISGRGKAPEKHAKGRKSGAKLSERHFIGRLAHHFGLVGDDWAWVAQGAERQLVAAVAAPRGVEDASNIDEGTQAVPAPIHAPPPLPPVAGKTMPQRFGRLEEEIRGLHQDIGNLRGLVERLMIDQVIMEYLVKISKKARILELKRRYLKITVLTSSTPYPSRKIRRICACTSQKTMNETRSTPCQKVSHMKHNCRVKLGKNGAGKGGSGQEGSSAQGPPKGQIIRDLYSFASNNVSLIPEISYVQEDKNDSLWLDSCATSHVCNDERWFDNMEPVNDGSFLRMADEGVKSILGNGVVNLLFISRKTITLYDVLYVPKVRKNLVSSSLLNRLGYKQVIESDRYVLSKSGMFVGFGYYCDCMFRLNVVNKLVSCDNSLFMTSTTNLDNSMLWHARLGHVNFRRKYEMSKDGLIPAFDIHSEKCKITLEGVMEQETQPVQKSKRGRIKKDFGLDFHLLLSRDVAFWKEAIDDEMSSILENNTWVLSDLPPGSKPLGCKWIFKNKMKVDGTIDKFKASTPMDPSVKLTPNKGMGISQLKYSQAIGYLMYAMTNTRPDIAYAVGKLSKYTSNPGTQHWQAIQRVFKYFKGTMNYGLSYSVYPSVLEGYSNASWISNVDDHSFTSGWVFLLGGGAISWASKKQSCITDSTMDTEFVALAAAGKEAEWLRNLIYEISL